MKIVSVVGARPNFMKVAPLHKAFQKYPNIKHLICHTGQHYDEKMSKVFFEELELPKPDFYLGIGSGSHAVQTAKTMIEFEKILIDEKPNLVLVVGDVNSTVACSLTAAKLNIKVAHVEAGLRSNDRTMPEELNRIVTDNLSDYLFVTEKSGLENLKREGIPGEKVFFTGNVMIDNIPGYMPKIELSKVKQELNLHGRFCLMTLHRPANVDNKDFLVELKELLSELAHKIEIVFPVHPRTKNNLNNLIGEEAFHPNVKLCEPLGYIDFMYLVKNSAFILTDSGGIQEESTYLNVPCITVRDNTERPSTVEVGSNILAGTDLSNVKKVVNDVLSGNIKKGSIPELWDGKAAERICNIISTLNI